MKSESENDVSKLDRSHRFGMRDNENGGASDFNSTF